MLKESLKLDKKTRFSDIFNDDEDNRWWWRCDVLRNAKQMQCIDHQQQNIFYRTRKFSRRFFLFATKEMRSMFGLHERVDFYNKSPIRMHHTAYSQCATVNKTIRRIWRGRHTVHQLNYKLWFAKVNKIERKKEWKWRWKTSKMVWRVAIAILPIHFELNTTGGSIFPKTINRKHTKCMPQIEK